MRIAQTSLIAIALLIAASASAQEYRYAVIELPGLTNDLQWAGCGGINSAGDVVGFTAVDSNYIHAAVWPHDGGVVDLGTLGGDYSAAASINDRGEIAGWAGFRPGSGIYTRRACVWRDGQIIDLGTLGGESSYAIALNEAGQVVGNSEYELSNYAERAMRWQNGEMVALPGAREGTYGRYAHDINTVGLIVGSGSGLDFQYNGLLWRDGVVTDLGSLSGQGSSAQAINESGLIVGQSKSGSGSGHAVLWINGRIVDIHPSGSSQRANSWGMDINNTGQVIGAIGNYLNTRQLFISELGQPTQLVEDLCPPRSGINWRMDRGAINDAGQIAITAFPEGNLVDSHALLLTPVQPSMELAAPFPGSAGTENTITVTGVTPGARVTFLYSRHGGGTRIPGCDLQQNALQLDNPTVIGTAIANGNGVATITRPVPLIARGQTILFQAVVQNECAISQLVVWRFE